MATDVKFVFLAVAALWPNLAAAQSAQQPATTFSPGVSLGELYTSNAFPQENDERKTSWITSIGALLGVSHRGALWEVSADMRLTKQLYSGASDRNRVDRALNANSRLELIDDMLQVGSRASVARRARSAFGASLSNSQSGSMTTDQIETRQVSVRPEWHSRMGPSLVLQASTDASASNSDETATRHVRSTDSIVSVGSDPRAQPLLGWSVSTQWQQFTGSELDRHVRKALGTVLFNPGGSLGYSLYSGREQNDLQDGNSSAASIWGAGVRWIPHERIAIAGTAGKRFFGTEYAVAIAYRRPLSAIRLTAVRDVGYLGNRMETGNVSPFVGMLTDLLRSNLPDPVARETVVRGRLREAAIPYTLGAPLDSATATPFLNQRLEFAYLYSGIRDTFTVSLGFRKQNAFPGNSTPQTLAFESTRQKNAGATWAHRLTRSVSLNYNFQFVQTEDLRLESRQTLQRLHTLSTATQLTPRTTLSFLARRLDLQSTAIRSYVENSLACNLETRF